MFTFFVRGNLMQQSPEAVGVSPAVEDNIKEKHIPQHFEEQDVKNKPVPAKGKIQ